MSIYLQVLRTIYKGGPLSVARAKAKVYWGLTGLQTDPSGRPSPRSGQAANAGKRAGTAGLRSIPFAVAAIKGSSGRHPSRVISACGHHNIPDRGDRDRREGTCGPQLLGSSPAALDGWRPALTVAKVERGEPLVRQTGKRLGGPSPGQVTDLAGAVHTLPQRRFPAPSSDSRPEQFPGPNSIWILRSTFGLRFSAAC